MNTVEIIPGTLKGQVLVPPSKSIAHRAVISAGLANGESVIRNITLSDDIAATIQGMRSLGAAIQSVGENRQLRIQGGKSPGERMVDCAESGSTLRFLIPLALIIGGRTTFTGRGKLSERPLNDYFRIFDEQGIIYRTSSGRLPLTIEGVLKPGVFQVRGDTSSQFVSGLLFALPLLPGDSRIVIQSTLESRGYVDLTLQMLRQFGIVVENRDYAEFLVPGRQRYHPADIFVEGDFSQAAFWLASGVLGADLRLRGLNRNSLQGDKVILNIIEAMGGKLVFGETFIQALPGDTSGIELDVSQCPDLVPVLTVLASLSRGTTRITNAARLRIKESDRLAAIAGELNKIGAQVREEKDGLLIQGREHFTGGSVESWNDHRIAMALAVAALKCREPLVIVNSGAVSKSYPDFWRDFKDVGGKIHEQHLG